jgi:integrase
MATIANRNGYRAIQFTNTEGKRTEVRLGRVNQRNAEAFRIRAETILADLRQGLPHDAEVSNWIGKLSPELIGRMERAGLVKGLSRRFVTLGDFLDRYMDEREATVKDNTQIFYRHTKRCLLEHFTAKRMLRTIALEDAEGFRSYLETTEAQRGEGKLSPATINRRIGAARTIFGEARKRKIISENPFEFVRGGESVNRERQFFVTRDVIDRLLEKCPDAEWRLMVVLARYGGVRVPSEVLSLRWEHVDFDDKRVTVPSPKTEHHEGGDQRVIPLFPELLQPLQDCLRQVAGEQHGFVITRYRQLSANLRTQFIKIMRRAGVDPWPKPWQNLRSTRETELLREFPLHTVCRWIGNTARIAQKHYLQVTDADFEKACRSSPSAMQAQ